jgi:hypothetical protein
MSLRLHSATVGALALLLSSGCYSVSVRAGTLPDGRRPESRLNWHFVYGLTGSDVSAPECRYGIAKTNTHLPWWSVALLSPLTLGLVATSATEYECSERPDQQPAAPASSAATTRTNT